MPTFHTLSARSLSVEPGAYIAKITKATERVSERGNAMIVMTLSLPDGRTLPCVLTFVDAARPVVNAFCDSLQLLKPLDPDVEVELTAAHCRGRYLYILVAADIDENGETVPRITRFITREAALRLNPALSEVTLQPQAPLALPVVQQPFGNNVEDA